MCRAAGPPPRAPLVPRCICHRMGPHGHARIAALPASDTATACSSTTTKSGTPARSASRAASRLATCSKSTNPGVCAARHADTTSTTGALGDDNTRTRMGAVCCWGLIGSLTTQDFLSGGTRTQEAVAARGMRGALPRSRWTGFVPWSCYSGLCPRRPWLGCKVAPPGVPHCHSGPSRMFETGHGTCLLRKVGPAWLPPRLRPWLPSTRTAATRC
jgi:hypothetical protein